MRTVQATDKLVSIWISREQPPGRREMGALVRQALAERGLAPWPEVEAECFAAGEDTLLIARPGRPSRAGFFFADLEALLAAALANAPGESSLYAAPGGYILTVDRAAAGPALYEFGDAFPAGADWEAHAAEQGRPLIRGDAIAALGRYFGGQV